MKPELPPLGLLALPAFPNSEGLCPPAELVPNTEGDALPLVDEAPTFPNKEPALDPVFEVFWLEPKGLPEVPKRPPLDAPLEAGLPKENDMAICSRGQGYRQAWVKKQTKEPPATDARTEDPAEWTTGPSWVTRSPR